jgi:hypothetical protein
MSAVQWVGAHPLPIAGGDGGSANRPILVELLEVLRYSWMVFWNLALFLAFANVLHR